LKRDSVTARDITANKVRYSESDSKYGKALEISEDKTDVYNRWLYGLVKVKRYQEAKKKLVEAQKKKYCDRPLS